MRRKRMALLVEEGTHEWFMEEIQRLCAAHEAGIIICPGYNPDTRDPRAPKVSVNAFLLMLLEARQKHRERRRKSRKTKRTASARRPTRANVEGHPNAEQG